MNKSLVKKKISPKELAKKQAKLLNKPDDLDKLMQIPDTARINHKHPAQPKQTMYIAPEIASVLLNFEQDYVKFSVDSWAKCSMKLMKPMRALEMSKHKNGNPAYNVNGCYIGFLVPLKETETFQMLFNEEKIDEIFRRYACYIGVSNTIEPSDRVGGRINSCSKGVVKHITTHAAPIRSNAKEASAHKIAQQMFSQLPAYLNPGESFDKLINCLFFSYIDVNSMMGPNNEQLCPLWVERTLITMYKNNGKLVNQV